MPRAKPPEAYLFVYGTLRAGAPGEPGAGNPMMELLQKRARRIGRGRVRGRLYQVDWYPGLRHSPSARDSVVGDVYALADCRALLRTLDAYEEASVKPKPEAEYLRRKKVVALEDGGKIDAWTYIYNRNPDESRRIPSGDFLAPDARRASSRSGNA